MELFIQFYHLLELGDGWHKDPISGSNWDKKKYIITELVRETGV